MWHSCLLFARPSNRNKCATSKNCKHSACDWSWNHLQSPNLEADSICTVTQRFPQDNTVCNHSCSRCMKLIYPSVYHKFCSIWCSLAKRLPQVRDCTCQFVHKSKNVNSARCGLDVSTWRRWDSNSSIILSRFPAPPHWTGNIDTSCRDFVELLNLFFINWKYVSTHAVLRMSCHVIGPLAQWRWQMYLSKRSSQDLLHLMIVKRFVTGTALANLFTDLRVSGLPMHAIRKHLKTTW